MNCLDACADDDTCLGVMMSSSMTGPCYVVDWVPQTVVGPNRSDHVDPVQALVLPSAMSLFWKSAKDPPRGNAYMGFSESFMVDYSRGARFDVEIVPRILGVSPTHASLAGGADLTIYGSGFGAVADDLDVVVGETSAACRVERISEDAVFCRVQPLGRWASSVPGSASWVGTPPRPTFAPPGHPWSTGLASHLASHASERGVRYTPAIGIRPGASFVSAYLSFIHCWDHNVEYCYDAADGIDGDLSTITGISHVSAIADYRLPRYQRQHRWYQHQYCTDLSPYVRGQQYRCLSSTYRGDFFRGDLGSVVRLTSVAISWQANWDPDKMRLDVALSSDGPWTSFSNTTRGDNAYDQNGNPTYVVVRGGAVYARYVRISTAPDYPASNNGEALTWRFSEMAVAVEAPTEMVNEFYHEARGPFPPDPANALYQDVRTSPPPPGPLPPALLL